MRSLAFCMAQPPCGPSFRVVVQSYAWDRPVHGGDEMPCLYRNMAKSRMVWLLLLCVGVYDLSLQLADHLGVEETRAQCT